MDRRRSAGCLRAAPSRRLYSQTAAIADCDCTRQRDLTVLGRRKESMRPDMRDLCVLCSTAKVALGGSPARNLPPEDRAADCSSGWRKGSGPYAGSVASERESQRASPTGGRDRSNPNATWFAPALHIKPHSLHPRLHASPRVPSAVGPAARES
jgi:hypothetical protein